MYEPLGLENLALAAGIGFVSGIVGTLGIKAVFAFKKLTGKKHHAAQPHTATATQQPTSPPPPATREDWERHGFGPAIVGAEMIGGVRGRWSRLAERAPIGMLMT